MTRVEFDKELNNIDFNYGSNTQQLEHFLLACLYQLEVYKQESPSYELFLKIYDQARSNGRVEFDPSWKKLYLTKGEFIEQESNDVGGLEEVIHEIRSLVTDLVNTREIRSQPHYVGKEMAFEWDSEGGLRFYNGTTPGSILGHAATRFEGEYSPQAYEEVNLSWQSFTDPLWIGISYE